MNTTPASELIQKTFPEAFDKPRFRSFAINVLNRLDESKAHQWSTQYVKDAFKGHVHRYERLGTYTSPDKEKVDVLIVYLTTESKLERARTAILNFVADHLKTRDEKDAALVAFVSPTEKQWRFSYVKMEYATIEKESGKVGVETRLTPARRFSYLVGEGESCHTAQTRFLDLLHDTATDPTLAQIEEAFSVEAVTKEFFTKYAELFADINAAMEELVAKDKTLRDEFNAKGVNTVDLAKKLMGQIVFLYFLQKKGWLGVENGQDWGTGPRDFLRRLAKGDYGKYANFFNDILEPLFYDTLATDRGHEAWCNRFKCRIPFLNGGLSEPLGGYDWKKTDIILPNKLFTNGEHVEEGITGTGVLDVFDRYNFTVNEAEPLEKEVAIDPEMLGKVFENLLDVKERKSKGSFYTPREIVHYMCQQSLINYLDTALNTDKAIIPRKDIETLIYLGDQISHYESVDAKYSIRMPATITTHARLIDEKLGSITVCDPAIGSGAFPVGMMHEIVRARSALTPYFNDVRDRTAYHFKRHAIQNCLYGVDIDPGAVEIAKLRLWLSLVVDEDDVKQIKPLPNLDYKIVVGNSLMGFPFKSQRQKEIEKLKLKFFDEPDHDIKAKLKKQIDNELIACFAAAKKSLGYEVTFDFEVWFSEVFDRKGGFDVVIANPPYVRQEGIKELKPVLQNQFQCYTGVADLFVYFYERGVKLLRVGGTIALITSNKFHHAGYGEKLRGFLARELTLHRLIDFGDAPVFEAIAYASILVGVRTGPGRDASALAYSWEKEMSFERIAQIVPERGQQIRQDELKPDGWRLESPAVLRLLEKLRRVGRPLGKYVKGRFHNGVKSGHTEAFVVDQATRDRLIREDNTSAKLFKPYLAGRDLKWWCVKSRGLWLIYVPWHFPLHEDTTITSASPKAEAEFKKLYPAIYRHLEQFKDELIDRDKAETGVRYEWYVMARPPFEIHKACEQPKIILGIFMNKPTYAFDTEGFYLNNAQHFIGGASPYLVGVLNSGVCWWFLTQICTDLQNGYLQALIEYQVQIPIPAVGIDQQKPVERVVERIVSAKRRGAGADVGALERELDELVYALYALTPEEIRIVEGKA